MRRQAWRSRAGKTAGEEEKEGDRGIINAGLHRNGDHESINNKEERKVYGICARQQGMEEGGRERNGMIDRRLRERREELLGPRHCREISPQSRGLG